MAPRPEPDAGRGRILVTLEALIAANLGQPRALREAPTALERLDLIGGSVVLVGSELGERRLHPDPRERAAWARRLLGLPDLDVATFDEPDDERPRDGADLRAIEGWRDLREAWQAGRLVTNRPASVGPARRAGLEVVRIGPRGGDASATVERPDHEARDLLHAVSSLLVEDTFAPDD